MTKLHINLLSVTFCHLKAAYFSLVVLSLGWSKGSRQSPAFSCDDVCWWHLIHWAKKPSCTPDELIATAQTATYAWGGLVIATRVAMKPEKCYAYFLSYWYDKGQGNLRMIRSLPSPSAYITLSNGTIAPCHLKVPLTDGASAPIPTLDSEKASLMLGVYFGPLSGGGTHI